MAIIKSIKTVLFCNNFIIANIRKCSLETKFVDKVPKIALQQRLLKVAVIGMPNAGKSTFINRLMDRKVCPVSSKVHTTRKRSCAIFTEHDAQIVFLDTPGLVNDRERKQYKLETAFVEDSNACLKEADVISVIHDVSNFWLKDRLDIKIINLLEKYIEKPSLLILNKIDAIKSKRKLLGITRTITENCINRQPTSAQKREQIKDADKRGWPYFAEVFMVSSLAGDGLDDVKDYFIKEAKPNEWMFPENIWSDQTAENIIVTSVKAKFLDFLPQEIPYLLETYMEYYDINEKGVITAVVLVRCPTERIKKLIAGISDGRLRQITESVQSDLQNTFDNFVRIRIVLEAQKE